MTPEIPRPEEISHQNGLEQAIDRYKQSDSFLALSKNTRLAYTTDLAQFKRYCQTQGVLSITALSPQESIDWLETLRAQRCSQSTSNRKRASLSTFLNWAQTEGIIQPDFTISLPKCESVEKKQPRILSAEEMDSLISKAKNLRDASLILISLVTGATITEIVNLNAGDILKIGDGNTAIIFKGGIRKTQPRILEVNKKAGSKIAEYIKDSGLKPEDPLFRGFRGQHERGRLARQGLNFILNAYATEIGVENLNPRMLRNTFIANFTGTPHKLSETLGRKR